MTFCLVVPIMRIVLSMKRLMLLHRSWIVPLKKVITMSSLPVTKNSIIKGTTNKHQAPVQNINDNNGSIPDLEVLRSQFDIDTLVSNIASLTRMVSNINRPTSTVNNNKKTASDLFCSYFSSFSYCWSSH